MKQILSSHIQAQWLLKEKDLIFQICDELIKNAFKSNYKFLLIREILQKKMIEKDPTLKPEEAENRLQDLFDSGEKTLVEEQFRSIKDMDKISESVRDLLNLENQSHDGKKKEENKNYEPLLRVKKLSQKYKIHVKFKLEKKGDEVLITVSNGSPIMENDVQRIQKSRFRFRQYHEEGRPEFFFIENIDMSGGGYGLGYALMDSILLQMNLVPAECLYLVTAAATMVTLSLPCQCPVPVKSAASG